MKTLRQFSLDPILIMVIFSIIPKGKHNSDSNGSPEGKTQSNEQDIIAIIVTNGSWKISCYWKSEYNEMINFNGFTFSFGANDVLTVTDETNSYKGTWSLIEIQENTESKLKFNINLGNPIYFVKMVDGWENIEKSSNYFEIRDYSLRNGVTDFLTFSKN
ncbi:hypothetical protein ACFX5E_00775 [Flavobacterium sp. LS2P90]|uniref:Lipocalin-like domain-containing protein n=1 Tax=Flavobacterium xylosi TaxID=3230415 RepID=A0ABW6HRG8_9FLAO